MEWVQEDFRTWNAISGDAFYTAFLSSDDRWKVYFKGSAIGDSETLEDAQKMAETHRDKLLLLQLEPAPALQATQYLLGYFDHDRYTIDFLWKSTAWCVSLNGGKVMDRNTGEFNLHGQFAEFETPAEAAECFYRHYPNLKPQQQPQQ